MRVEPVVVSELVHGHAEHGLHQDDAAEAGEPVPPRAAAARHRDLERREQPHLERRQDGPSSLTVGEVMPGVPGERLQAAHRSAYNRAEDRR